MGAIPFDRAAVLKPNGNISNPVFSPSKYNTAAARALFSPASSGGRLPTEEGLRKSERSIQNKCSFDNTPSALLRPEESHDITADSKKATNNIFPNALPKSVADTTAGSSSLTSLNNLKGRIDSAKGKRKKERANRNEPQGRHELLNTWVGAKGGDAPASMLQSLSAVN